jgi:hypothetical protein
VLVQAADGAAAERGDQVGLPELRQEAVRGADDLEEVAPIVDVAFEGNQARSFDLSASLAGWKAPT